MSETPAANILGTIGTVCWCIQLIPQIIHNYRHKNCEGLRPLMLFLWSASGVPFSIYFVSRRSSIPIMVQPQIFTTLCVITWAQALYYPPVQVSRKRLITLISTFLVVGIALEAGFIIPCRNAYDDGTEWPSLIFGVIASILLAVGLVPPYFELAKRQGRVVGINFVFLSLDFSGAFFSILSLVFAREMDIMGIVLYCIVAAMELGIFTSHVIWWIRIGRHQKKTVDDEEAHKDVPSDTEEDSLDVVATVVADEAKLSKSHNPDLTTQTTLVLGKDT